MVFCRCFAVQKSYICQRKNEMGKIATFLKKKSPLIWELSTTTQITSIRSFLRVTAAPHKPRRCCTIHQNSKTKVCQRHPLSNLHVNIYDTKKSQTWEKQFWSRLLSSLQCGAQWGSPPPNPPGAPNWAQNAQLRGWSGDEWRWHWCHLAGIHKPFHHPLPLTARGETLRERGAETQSPRYRPH